MNKNIVIQKIREVLTEKLHIAQQAMLQAQESANSEQKNTAGDKYETAKAMSQIERDQYAMQYQQHSDTLAQFDSIDFTKSNSRVELGALVATNMRWLLIAVNSGDRVINGNFYTAISPNSPLAKALWGKQAGDKVEFMGKKWIINNIS